MSGPDYASVIDRLGAAARDCRELLRQAHEAQRDLRGAIREAKEARRELADMLGTITDAVGASIEREVVTKLDELGEHVNKSMRDTTAKILEEFDTLANPLRDALDEMMQAQKILSGPLVGGMRGPEDPISQKMADAWNRAVDRREGREL